MTNGSNRGFGTQPVEDAVVAAPGHDDAMPPDLLDLLEKTILARGAADFSAFLAACAAQGIDNNRIVDHFIPAAARTAGVQWCEDGLSFVDVTVAVARLQGLLHRLSPGDDSPFDICASAVLLVAPEGTDHTLGAEVLAEQLRRHGIYVRRVLQATPDIVVHELRRDPLDAVFVSAGQGAPLEKIRRLVQAARTVGPNGPCVVIGGGVLEDNPDITELTGADIATSDMAAALKACGIAIPAKDRPRAAARA
ncbi:cobalamin-dependent protein [Limimaricola sp.]|uniref:cobalamin-dependent protein n=1 Tax=Limimaricola sp. TaxID=2211665 RepID=UPI0025B8BE69|nr:cobalamin-dependent protein [Limimaricola sp.]